MTIPSSYKIFGERPSPLVRIVHNFFTAGLDSGQPSLVPRRSASLSARSLGKSGRVSLGDVTAHGRVQD